MEENNIKPFPKISLFKKGGYMPIRLLKIQNNSLPEINNIISEPEIKTLPSKEETLALRRLARKTNKTNLIKKKNN